VDGRSPLALLRVKLTAYIIASRTSRWKWSGTHLHGCSSSRIPLLMRRSGVEHHYVGVGEFACVFSLEALAFSPLTAKSGPSPVSAGLTADVLATTSAVEEGAETAKSAPFPMSTRLTGEFLATTSAVAEAAVTFLVLTAPHESRYRTRCANYQYRQVAVALPVALHTEGSTRM
jgi:hypothetical protein